jgi:transposase-like protein
MSIVTLHLPEVKAYEPSRPKRCPSCGGETFQRWGGTVRRVRDPHINEVLVCRFRCCTCHHTFRHYPEGISQASQTARMKALAAIGWIMGLSYRGGSIYLGAFRVNLGRMSIWRDVQERAEEIEKVRHWKAARVVGVDGAYVRGWGETQKVFVVVDMGTGDPITVGYLDEKDPQAVKKFLEPLVQSLGISVTLAPPARAGVVTDDLASYRQVTNDLQLEHQVCQFHLRRWVGRTLHELKHSLPTEWLWMVDELRQLMADLPIEGDKRLVTLARQLPPAQAKRAGEESTPFDQLRYVVLRLAENWPRYRIFDWQPDVPWTNNPTEQVIGRMKMRARTVRGYKNWRGMFSGLMAAGVNLA